MERVSPNHGRSLEGAAAAGIIILSAALGGTGCTSAEERDEGFIRGGERMASAPAEGKKEDKKEAAPPVAEPKAEPEKKADVPPVSEGVINLNFPSYVGGGVAFRKIDGIEVTETVHRGQLRVPVFGDTFAEINGSVGYASARTPAGHQDGVMAGGQFRMGHFLYNDGKEKGRLFGTRTLALGVHAGYAGVNFDDADLKNRHTPSLGAGALWIHTADNLTFQASAAGSHYVGATEERRRGLNGERNGWTGRADASVTIDDTFGNSGTTIFGYGNIERTVTGLKTQVDGMGTGRLRTTERNYQAGGGIVQGLGNIVYVGPTFRYGDMQQGHSANVGGPRPDDRRTELVIGGVGAVNLPYGLQLTIQGGKDLRNSKTHEVVAGLGVRF